MSSDAIAIRVRDVTKHYLMFERPEDRLKQSIVPRLQRLAGRAPKQYYRDFAALNGVSFEVKRGETVGIIGRNGCGKSTLLQIICGTLQPTSGTVEVNGRIAALLELGAGFNPEFSGRDNVYMNGAILGLSRAEIDARFDSIARFADIGMFLDQPVKTYSSGMYVRLAFATAINVDPDILVVDEALSVGDEAFQRKCFARIENIKEKGGTILFVSHGAQTIVQLCDRAILIDRGEKLLEGRPKTVVGQYQRLVNLSGAEAEPVREEIRRMNGTESFRTAATTAEDEIVLADKSLPNSTAQPRASATLERFDPNLVSQSRVDYEQNGAKIGDLRILNLADKQVNILARGNQYVFEYVVTYADDAQGVAFGMLIKTVNGIELAGIGTNLVDQHKLNARAGQQARVRMQFDCNLAPGVYFLNCGAGAYRQKEPVMLHRILDGLSFRVIDEGKQTITGHVDLHIVPSIQIDDHQLAS